MVPARTLTFSYLYTYPHIQALGRRPRVLPCSTVTPWWYGGHAAGGSRGEFGTEVRFGYGCAAGGEEDFVEIVRDVLRGRMEWRTYSSRHGP
jgi:hypothetical protein